MDANAPITVGIPDQGFEVTDAGAAVFQEALDVLARAGAKIVRVRLPKSFESLVSAGIIVMYAELAAFHRDLYSRRAAEYPPRLRVLVEAGFSIAAADYINAQRVRDHAASELSSALAGVTALLTPTTGSAAPLRHESTGDWRFNLPFSASGHPAITLPCGFSTNGLPLGIQAVTSHGRENQLFNVGRLFQQHSDWHRRRAPMKAGLD
jgi:Asp-tRNA(Asn)/Glu-tRNA(Gln) amidotransferase A subunit family amidase